MTSHEFKSYYEAWERVAIVVAAEKKAKEIMRRAMEKTER